MNIGIIGLRGSGRTTLFSSFIGEESHSATGIVSIPDTRLDLLSRMYEPEKTTCAKVAFEDCYPLDTTVKQEKIKLLDRMKVMDAFVMLVGAHRHLSREEVIGEFKQVRFEQIINDLDFVTKRVERLQEEIIKISKDRDAREKELALMKRLQPILEGERMLRGIQADSFEASILSNANLLTLKPICYVLNFSEGTADEERKGIAAEIQALLEGWGESSHVIAINAALEAEIAAMSHDERESFLREYGISSLGREKVIRSAHEMMRMITFFTVGKDECRSWELRDGATALDAAGAIHSDLARGFIRAEVIDYKALIDAGSLNDAKKAGVLRVEGRTYVVKDGEIVHIMFNV
jgi:hypothetical protein